MEGLRCAVARDRALIDAKSRRRKKGNEYENSPKNYEFFHLIITEKELREKVSQKRTTRNNRY